MPLTCGCPECGTDLNVPDEAVGRKLRCKRCAAVFVAHSPEHRARPEKSTPRLLSVLAAVCLVGSAAYKGMTGGRHRQPAEPARIAAPAAVAPVPVPAPGEEPADAGGVVAISDARLTFDSPAQLVFRWSGDPAGVPPDAVLVLELERPQAFPAWRTLGTRPGEARVAVPDAEYRIGQRATLRLARPTPGGTRANLSEPIEVEIE